MFPVDFVFHRLWFPLQRALSEAIGHNEQPRPTTFYKHHKAVRGLCFMAFITATHNFLYRPHSGEGRSGRMVLASPISHLNHWNPRGFILVVNQGRQAVKYSCACCVLEIRLISARSLLQSPSSLPSLLQSNTQTHKRVIRVLAISRLSVGGLISCRDS